MGMRQGHKLHAFMSIAGWIQGDAGWIAAVWQMSWELVSLQGPEKLLWLLSG